MADQEAPNEQQTAPPAPPRTVSSGELVALYEQMHEREFNAETKIYKNPVSVMRYAIAYGKIAAARLVDAFRRIAAAEERIAQFETRVAAVEKFRDDALADNKAALAQLEEMMRAEEEKTKAAAEAGSPPDPSVVPIKPAKKKDAAPGNGGAA